jgi:hypothetical protein
MEDNKDFKESLVKVANEATGNLVYTVIFDMANDLIAKGAVDEATVLESASGTIQKYLDTGVKVRKKPVARPKAPKAPTKEKAVDAMTAASKKLNSLTGKMLWVTHPEDDNYSYSTTVKLANGFPLKDNSTGKIVRVVTDDNAVALTVQDAKVAISYGLEVDYDSIQQKS